MVVKVEIQLSEIQISVSYLSNNDTQVCYTRESNVQSVIAIIRIQRNSFLISNSSSIKGVRKEYHTIER